MTTVYRFDLSHLLKSDLRDPVAVRRLWDETHLVTSLQGIVNRKEAVLYLRYNDLTDEFWWAEMRKPGAWMADAEVVELASLDELLDQFRSSYHGAVVYDERVPATSNLASTIAGVDDLLCLRYDAAEGSLYRRLTESRRLTSVVRLLADDNTPLFTGTGTIPGTSRPSTGSAKNDAYLWLNDHYLARGRTNARLLGYYIDAFWLQCGWCGLAPNHTLTNHDFVIANRGLFFDLNVWEDEAPVDEPAQRPGTDVATLKVLLATANDQLQRKALIHVAGYVPWRYKYTSCNENSWHAGSAHDAVPAEWKCTEILSAYNAYLDADALDIASMANASFFQHCPLKPVYRQTRRHDVESLKAQGLLDDSGAIVPRHYYAHYVGDYDSAAWLYWMLPEFWTNPARGSVTMSWAFNPNLAARFAFGMAWVRDSATPVDHFISGDSGAGYVNPRNLCEPRPYSGYPSGISLWEEHCRKDFARWDIQNVGFIIDGNTANMTDEAWAMYGRIAPNGVVMQRYPEHHGFRDGIPFIRTAGDLTRGEARDAASRVVEEFKGPTPAFHCFRSVLMPPSWYVEMERQIDLQGGADAVQLDLETLMALVRIDAQSRPGKES